MAELETNIITPENYSSFSDIPKDLKTMAQSIQAELNKKISDEKLDEEIEKINKVDNLQTKIINGLESELEQEVVEGTDLNIQGTAQARAKIIPIANTSQGSREGYNLFDKNSLTYKLGYYNINGEFTSSDAGTGYTTMKIPVVPNTDYTIGKLIFVDPNQIISANAVVGAVYFYDADYNWISRTFGIIIEGIYNFTTPENCSYIELQITIENVNNNNTFFDIIDTFMLLEGTYTNDTFPKYEAYRIMPSPNFLGPISYVRGKVGEEENVYEIKKQNKNLFNKDDLSYEMGFKDTVGNFQSSTLTGYTTMKIPVIANTEYTIGKLLTTDKSSSVANAVVNAIYFYDKDYNYITRTDSIKVYNVYSFTTLENCSYIELQITINPLVTGGNTFNDIIDSFMLVRGTYANDNFPNYVPYAEETLPLNLGDYKLAEVGDSKDHFDISYVDENGYKKITNVDYADKIIDEEIIDSDKWIKSANTTIDRFILDIPKNIIAQQAFSNYFKYEQNSFTIGTFFLDSSFRLVINYSEYGTTTLEDFKAQLQEWTANGNSLRVLRQRETPITTNVTDEILISQLEALLNVMTYSEVTNINTSKSLDVEEVADLKISVEYFKSNLSRIKSLEEKVNTLLSTSSVDDILENTTESEVLI